MLINKAHCLFEQSGTFKNEFVKLGIPAEDYDIQDEFGQTDHIVDLFEEIRGGTNTKKVFLMDFPPMILFWHFSLVQDLSQGFHYGSEAKHNSRRIGMIFRR